MPYDNANEAVHEPFELLSELLLSRYEIDLETSVSSDFIFDSVQLLYYKCHNIRHKRERS